jgi:hypothetical protein
MFAALSAWETVGMVGLFRVVIIAGLGIGAVALALLFVLPHGGAPAAAPKAAPAAATAGCQVRLLRDWSDGRIDGVYPLACYRAARRSLPADLKVYSSAPDDIAQALSQRIIQSHHPQKISGHQGAPSVRKVASAR